VDTPRKILEIILVEPSSAAFSMLANSNPPPLPPEWVPPKSNMAGEQYTYDNTERGVVSDSATPQPMQRVNLRNDIPTIRAYKDARTARIKAIGEKTQSAFSVGGPANETAMGRGTPFTADWL